MRIKQFVLFLIATILCATQAMADIQEGYYYLKFGHSSVTPNPALYLSTTKGHDTKSLGSTQEEGSVFYIQKGSTGYSFKTGNQYLGYSTWTVTFPTEAQEWPVEEVDGVVDAYYIKGYNGGYLGNSNSSNFAVGKSVFSNAGKTAEQGANYWILEKAKWPAPAFTDGHSDINTYKQYLQNLSYTTSAGTQSIFSNATVPTSVSEQYVITSDGIDCKQDETVTITWNFPSGANSAMYLSAYADFNGDGDFDDADEKIGVMGTFKANNNDILSNSIQFTVPATATVGATRIRLRFDSSWNTEIGSTGSYAPAMASTNRMVYDIPVTINSAADAPEAIAAMLERIGGAGASSLISAELDEEIAEEGKEVYIITSKNGKPHVKGSTLSAISAGIGYYLNHYAKVNLAWNNLTTNLSTATLPVPASEDKHVCSADYRYYLNYCTYSYSMSVWDEARWMKEIDWMALHGINMPLAIVGMEAVWQKLLTDADASKRITASADANALNAFVPGPSYQAWWLMGNLQGMGGPNPDWWYTHQAQLGKKIVDRMRELGMEPVLPGFAGQVPTAASGLDAVGNGSWCSFTAPALVKPGTDNFNTIASKYYAALTEVFGESKYYSMDLFHETGGAPSGIDAETMYKSVAAAMPTGSKWLIQQWQWSGTQGNSCSWVDEDKLIVLDLWSEVKQGWKYTYGGGKNFNGREMIYCMLHNFGGRTGIYGRLSQTINGYYEALNTSGLKTKGVGATPEGIETNPILYDALYEMPWTTISNVNDWVANWVEARYGTDNAEAKAAWALLTSEGGILNCTTQQQGVSEPIICARPGLEIPSASAWSTSKIYYDMQQVIKAADLLKTTTSLSGKNYSYDLTDVVRQVMTDQAQPLLAEIKKAYEATDWTKYDALVTRFTTLINDVDRLLATNEDFMLGRWTSLARSNAGSAAAPSWSNPNYADAGYNAGFTSGADWTEWNARKLITTWGYTAQCNNGRLRDYSQREWSGLLKDFYLPRWQKYFTQLKAGTNIGRENASWYAEEDAWCRNYSKQYTTTITEQTGDVATELFPKYFGKFAAASGDYYINLGLPSTDAKVMDNAFRGELYTPSVVATPEITKIGIDFNGNGVISEAEYEVSNAKRIGVPADAKSGKALAMITFSDGTEFTFTALIKDNVTEARTVAVVKPNAEQGGVTLAGADVTDAAGKLSVTTTSDVTITAVPSQAYDFVKWTKGGEDFSTQNPYIYTEKPAIELTPVFAQNKWAGVTEDKKEYSTVKSYSQYASTISFTPNAEETVEIYQASTCPENLYNVVPTMVSAAKGSAFTLSWTGKGLNYTRLSAYIDLNGDGDFDDKGEFTGTIGELSQQNAALNNSSMQFILPYDATEGLTHVRLRFDGAWETGNMTTDGGREPYATTTRMVYDVKLNITEYSTAPTTTITAVSADPAMGTVRITGGQIDNQNPAVVNEGKEVTLDATPADGYKFLQWVDEFGRVVSTDAHYVFRPAGSCTYRAEFIGNEDDYFYKGEGTVHSFEIREICSLQSLRKTGTWKISMDIKSNGSSFNQYGSVAIASGTQATDGYTFQLYMTKNGTVTLFGIDTGISVAHDFTAEISYDGNRIYGHFIGKDTNGDDKETGANNTWFFTKGQDAIGDITALSCALPEGVNIKTLTITANYDDTGWATPPSNLNPGDPYVTGNGQVVKMHAKDYITNKDSEGNTKYNYVPAGKAWQMDMTVTHTEGQKTSYNQWGSCILSSSSDPINTYYWNNFQVYEHAVSKGTLNFKSNKGDGNDHIIAQGHKIGDPTNGYADYRIIIRYDGSNVYLIRTIILDNEGNETNQVFNNVWIAARVQHDIDVMSCALPTGTNIKSLSISIAEESNLMEDVDYAIQNITTKDYLKNEQLEHSEMAGDAAHYQIKWTGRNDLTYTDTDGGLHHSFYIKVLTEDSWKWLKLDQSSYTTTESEEQATAFIYSDNSKMVQPIENKDMPGVAWSINANDTWLWDFFANFSVKVSGNNQGGLSYTKGSEQQTAINGQYIWLPAGVALLGLSNTSKPGYSASITKSDIFITVDYIQLQSGFYTFTDKGTDTPTTFYYDAESRDDANGCLSTYPAGERTLWDEKGDCSLWTIANETGINVNLSQNRNGSDEYFYGTLYSPVALVMPDGVKAYVAQVSEEDGTKLLLRRLCAAGEVLPKLTPVILYSEEAGTNTLPKTFAVASEDPTFDNTSNALTGVVYTYDRGTQKIYSLGRTKGIGFYNYTGAKVQAFKAFMLDEVASQVSAFYFVFDESGLTGVAGLEATQTKTAPYYDLSGRMIQRPASRGLYFQRGSKILTK